MSQSSLLVGLLAAAFLLYVAASGRLTVYTNVLWGKPQASGSGGSGSSGGSGGGSDGGGNSGLMDKAINLGEHALPFILAAG